MNKCLAAVVLLGSSLVGCFQPQADYYSCDYPDFKAVDEFGHPDPCHHAIPTPKPEVCQGECITMGTAGFRREPLLLWYGDRAPRSPPSTTTTTNSKTAVGKTDY